ncbi:MAG: hypothetical protein FJ119_06405 [Deltaproteobacteria bacterium]|nr:hypothetical protein [Deltaproteobacteria bacterium]
MNTGASLTNTELVARCCAGDNTAWRSFFERFNEFIDRQILRAFRLVDFEHEEHDFDTAKNAVVDILLDPRKLGAISEPERLKAWLATVCRSKARDVARARRSIKNSADEAAKRSMLSLQQSTGRSDSDSLLEHNVASDCPAPDCLYDEDLFAAVQSAIEALEWIYQCPLKVSLIFHADFLREADMLRIAAERSVSPGVVRDELSCLLDDLLRKHAANIRHEAALRVAAAYVERLKARCHMLANSCSARDEIATAARLELEKNEQRLAAILSGRNRPVTPGNVQIAAILGQKENVIATRLFRARKMLAHALLA